MAGVVGAASIAISAAAPALGPLLVALVIGVVAANTRGVSRYVVGTAPRLDRFLLRSGIVLLGLRVSVGDVVALGVPGLTVVLATVVTTYATTQVVGRLLGLERDLVTLIAAGASICGAAAIAAVESSIRARPQRRRAGRRPGDGLRHAPDRCRPGARPLARPHRRADRDLGGRQHPRGRPGRRRGVPDRRRRRDRPRHRDHREAGPRRTAGPRAAGVGPGVPLRGRRPAGSAGPALPGRLPRRCRGPLDGPGADRGTSISPRP